MNEVIIWRAKVEIKSLLTSLPYHIHTYTHTYMYIAQIKVKTLIFEFPI